MAALLDSLSDFHIWFRSELRKSMSEFVTSRGLGTGLTVSFGGTGTLYPASISLTRSSNAASASTEEELSEALGSIGRQNKRHTRIVLESDRFIQRRISNLRLPASRARRMAEIDLRANTPFKRSEIHILHPVEDERTETSYFIVKRPEIDPVIERLKASGCEIQSIELQTDEHSYVLGSGSHSDLNVGGFRGRLKRWLLIANLLLIVVGAALTFGIADRQIREAETTLDAEIEVMQARAGQVRRSFDEQVGLLEQMSTLRQRKHASGSTVVMIEELSQLLPDHTWLGDLTIDNQTITITGYSSEAVSIMPLLERSGRFANASFTTSVDRVPGQSFEKFALQTEFTADGAER